MKKQKKAFQNCSTNFIFLICFLLAACTNDAPKSEPGSDSLKQNVKPKKSQDGQASTRAVDQLLAILFLERQEFLNLPEKRLVFQFCIPDTGQQLNTFNLAIYNHGNLRYNPPAPIEVLHNSWMESQTDITDKKVFLGHSKLKKLDVENIKAALTDNPTHLFVVFYPELTNDRLIYKIYTKPSITVEALKDIYTSPKINFIATLNPSPPASDRENQND